MIKPGAANPPWEIELSDGRSKRKYGLKIVPGSLNIGTISQDDTVFVRNVGKRVGDFDEQRSWKSGRGTENLSDNAEAYWDSQNAWTLTPGHVHQSLQTYHARGLLNEDVYMPTRTAGNVKFIPLLGENLYISNSFAASASYSADFGYLWIRRRGSPGTLTFRLMSNSGGSPSGVLQTVTKSVSNIPDYVSRYQIFNWTGTQSLTSGTTYWVSVHGALTDTQDNHWEVGVNPDASSGKISSDGSSWSAASFAMYTRIRADGLTTRKWFSFVLREAWYIVDQKTSGSASLMYINGDRGMATAGGASSLTDSAKAWTTNRWTGAYVKIIAGTGVDQVLPIASNTGTVLTVTGTWETNPSTDSQYIIYGTEWFTAVTFSGGSPVLGAVTGQPVVINNVAYIPQGTSVFLHMQWNASTFAHDGFSETATGTQGLADIFLAANDPADGPVLWRANNNGNTGSGGNRTVSRASLLSSGVFLAWNAALTWKNAIFTGNTSYKITNLKQQNNAVYCFKEDGMGVIANDRYNSLESGIEKTPSSANGYSAIEHGQFLYYSWLHSLVRVYGSTHDDIGDDYRGIGLPDTREGSYSDMDSYLKLLFCGIDAGDAGTSSVLVWDGMGWHEIYRARRENERVRMVKIQVCPGTNNRLWINVGGDLVFMELPLYRSSPRLSSGARYAHEGVVESAALDMGTASAMPKFIKELTVTVRNLNTPGRVVYVDYQMDDDVGTRNWIYAGQLTRTPESTVFLGISCRRFAYRLRLCTEDNAIPIDVEGVVPNGFARTPFKLLWTMQVQGGGVFSRRGQGVSADALMRWLLDSAREPARVRMDSVYELAHGYHVIIHPARMFPFKARHGRNAEQASFTLTLEES